MLARSRVSRAGLSCSRLSEQLTRIGRKTCACFLMWSAANASGVDEDAQWDTVSMGCNLNHAPSMTENYFLTIFFSDESDDNQ